jgi:hypothetical protein
MLKIYFIYKVAAKKFRRAICYANQNKMDDTKTHDIRKHITYENT